MLTVREREVAAQVAARWPKRKADLFIKTTTVNGKPIRTEQGAIDLISTKPGAAGMGSPEVRLAYQRGQITPEGIEQAFRDLTAYCRSKGLNYMSLLDYNPEHLSELLLEGARQDGLF